MAMIFNIFKVEITTEFSVIVVVNPHIDKNLVTAGSQVAFINKPSFTNSAYNDVSVLSKVLDVFCL